jgi:predicted transcriptional regulator
MTANDDLHQLLDSLPQHELHAVRRFLEFLRDASANEPDPVLRAFFAAPMDDETLTDEHVAAINEGRDEAARGDVVPLRHVIAQGDHTA